MVFTHDIKIYSLYHEFGNSHTQIYNKRMEKTTPMEIGELNNET